MQANDSYGGFCSERLHSNVVACSFCEWWTTTFWCSCISIQSIICDTCLSVKSVVIKVSQCNKSSNNDFRQNIEESCLTQFVRFEFVVQVWSILGVCD